MIKPERLYPGDCIGIISPAGPPDPDELQKGVTFLRNMGLEVCLGNHIYKKQNYLAGGDHERLADLHNMFANPDIKGVFCARGGYGTARIAPYIDYRLLRRCAKIFWGYSDITYLHTAIQKYSGLITFHGPMIASDLGRNHLKEETLSSFKQLFSPDPFIYSEELSPLTVLKEGTGSGRLIGGNLTLIADSLGTPYEMDTDGAILFIEEINEPTYRIDAMLHHLEHAGKFKNLKGLVIGHLNLEAREEAWTRALLSNFLQSYHFPIMKGLQIGHCQPNYGIPLGTAAYLNTNLKTLTISSGIAHG